MVVDYRLGHAVSIDALKDLVDGAARAVKTHVPGPGNPPSRTRLCYWWTGPRLFILTDDYDMIGTGPMTESFAPLLDHLALGFKVRVHLVVARSASRAGRGLNDALLSRMMEVSTPGLLLSCPPSEGYVFGNVKWLLLIPGRGTLVARRKSMQVQTALVGSPEGNA
jgi:S-DNA-T family DNA segregation ATPase FtsK/SpoIIIE